MSVSSLLEILRAKEIKISLNGENLKINAPKGVMTAELQAEIAAHKADLIAFLRAAETTEPRAAPFRPYPHGSTLPLSFAQQRIWFLEQLNPHHIAYILSYSARVPASLDPLLLEKSLTEITRRHEILRASFHLQGDQPVQIIHPPMEAQVQVVNLGELDDEALRLSLPQRINAECARPFDLSKAPLFRVTLFHLGPRGDYLLFNIHHMIGDHASMRNFAGELSALYAAYLDGRPSPLEEMTVQYGDYVLWQQELMTGSLFDEQIAYWKRVLSGSPARVEIPADIPRSDQTDTRAQEMILAARPDLSKALEALAQRKGVSLFNLLLAAFMLLLFRLTRQEDLTVGTPVWGRLRPEFEQMIGLFLNTLTLRVDFSGSPTFLQALERVKETMLGAFSHQDIPFERIVEKIQPERSLNHHPFFDVFINFIQPKPISRGEQPIQLETISLNEPDAKFPITLYISQSTDQIHFTFLYRKALYSPGRMASLADQLIYLLEQIVQNPDLPVDKYSLVTPATRPLLPDPTLELRASEFEPVYALVERWAADHPQQTAVEQNGSQWSYAELVEKARRLASTLQQAGCRPNDVVALSGAKSFGLMVSVLGVLRSGGVLLPLDSTLPRQRQEIILREAQARWFVWVSPANNNTPSVHLPEGITCIQMNAQTGEVGPLAINPEECSPLPQARPDQPAYIFFTSGTTGIPKGVLGAHRGLSHFLTWQRDTFQIGPHDRAAQLTGLSFDVVLRDMLTPLISGACLCLPDPQLGIATPALLHWLQHNNITLLHTVPAIASSWVNLAETDFRVPSLRQVFFAGEPLLDSLCLRWREQFAPNCQIINLYGPTETTLAKCFYLVPEPPMPGVQPVGSPLPQTQALILNATGDCCGIAEPGEIVIRTPYRTLGYINAAEEQARRFLPNHFRADPEDLLYYTGDLGRFRPDGKIDILGRQDDQVKINGVRVELGEVTTALLDHPQVRAAEVLARKDHRGASLTAYMITTSGAEIHSDELRYHLAERLPLAMIPSRYVYLAQFPLTANGKVDRNALPEPPAIEAAGGNPYQARDVVEAKLIQIWKKLLRVDRLGIRDDFFALGGHSMLAVQMFIQIEETFGVNLPLTSLFHKANIEYLAELIKARRGSSPWSSLVPIQPVGSRTPLFFVHGLTGDVFWFGNLIPYMHPDQPLWGLQSQGLDGIQKPLLTIREMAALYIREMKSIQPEGPYSICGYSFGGSLAFEMACQLEAQGDEVGLLAIIDHANAKSGYYKVKVNRSFFAALIHNIPFRFADLLNLKPYQLFARIKRKLRASWRSITSTDSQMDEATLATNIIDHGDQLPTHIQKVIGCNYRAARQYSPGPYRGLVTLLRAQGGRLLVSHAPDMGWGKFAQQVKIRIVPGSHLSLFQPHRVQYLAQALQDCLDELTK